MVGGKGRFAGGNLVCGLNDKDKYNNTLQAISLKNKKKMSMGTVRECCLPFLLKPWGENTSQ